MAEPLLPESDTFGCWQAIGDDHYARASRFLDGVNPPPPLTVPLAEWAGGTVAALAGLAIPVDPGLEVFHDPQLLEDWDEWLEEAKGLGVLDTEQARTLKDTTVRINEITESTPRPDMLVMHGDMSHLNIIVTADGPALIDFDASGPRVPWWEMIGYLADPRNKSLTGTSLAVDGGVSGLRLVR